jgi:ElaB/YqjD/DUF883 family membrane-anchored ribosome-binding protein
MGKDADTIYREITEHRRRMSDRVDQLEHRVQEDVRDVKDRAAAHAAPPAALTDRASEHPLTALAVGFGLGIAAGMLSEAAGGLISHGDSRNGRHDARSNGRHDDRGMGAPSFAVGSLSSMLFGFAGDAIRPLVDDVVAGFKGDERSPAERSGDEDIERLAAADAA